MTTPVFTEFVKGLPSGWIDANLLRGVTGAVAIESVTSTGDVLTITYRDTNNAVQTINFSSGGGGGGLTGGHGDFNREILHAYVNLKEADNPVAIQAENKRLEVVLDRAPDPGSKLEIVIRLNASMVDVVTAVVVPATSNLTQTPTGRILDQRRQPCTWAEHWACVHRALAGC